MRLADAAHKLVLDPSKECTQLESWTVRDMVRTDLWRGGVPWVVRLMRRSPRPWC